MRVLVVLLLLLAVACNPTDLAEEIANQALEDEGVSVDLDDDGGVTIRTSEGEITADVNSDGVSVQGPDGEIDVEAGADGEFTVEGPDGTITGGTGELPPDFPSAFPLPEGYSVTSSVTTTGDANAFIFVLALPGSLQDAVRFYEAELPAAGYTIVSTFDSADAATFSFEGSGQTGNVGLTSQSGELVLSGQIEVAR